MNFSGLEKSSGGGMNFIKFKPGESVRGVFRGEIHSFGQHWSNNKSILCKGKDCQLCKDGEKAGVRYRLNLIVKENEAYTAKIFEQGRIVFGALEEINTDYPLENHLMKITRNGVGTDTTYSIVPVPNGELKGDILKQVDAVKLLPLGNGEKGEQSQVEEDAPF